MLIGSNQLITVTLSGIMSVEGDTFGASSAFVTDLDPMLTTPLSVRTVAGSYIEDISDDVLNQLILKYSIEAKQLAICDTTQWEKWDYYAAKWVEFSVATDSIYNSKSFLGEAGGKVYKKLGDFAISKDSSSGGSGPARSFINKLECEIFKLNVSVRQCREPLLDCKAEDAASTYAPLPAKTVTKGQSVPRPLFDRGVLRNGWHEIIKNY
jgi:hypothetical protein